MARENESKRLFGDNPVTRMNTFEKLTALSQPKRRIETSTILTTPEAIVRNHRAQVLRLKNKNSGRILTNRPPRIPWHRKTNWRAVSECALWVLLALITAYFVISFLFGPLVSQVSAKEVDISVSVNAIYDRGKWRGGPDGAHRKAEIAPAFEGQVKYTGWKYQPTLAISYGQEKFDFSAQGATIQEASPRVYGIHIGATREFKHFSAYGLVGVTHFQYRPGLTENFTGETVVHKGTPDDNLLSLKFGVNKLWNIGGDLGGIKIGPEISTDIYPVRPGFDRCRRFRMNPVVPHAGVRVQW